MNDITFTICAFIEPHGDCDIEVTGYFEDDDPGNGRDDPGGPGCFEASEYHYVGNSGTGDGTCDDVLKEWIDDNENTLWHAVSSHLDDRHGEE